MFEDALLGSSPTSIGTVLRLRGWKLRSEVSPWASAEMPGWTAELVEGKHRLDTHPLPKREKKINRTMID